MPGLRTRIDLIGQRFGRLVVLGFSGVRWGQAVWQCRCDCGGETIAAGYNLRKVGGTRSCGCLRDEKTATRRLTHGHCKGRRRSPEIRSWNLAKSRCYSPTNPNYADYGGRGITMCERWRIGSDGKVGFECFLEDMGPRPSKAHTLERVDNSKGYQPDNCVWATRKDQSRNRRGVHLIIVDGEQMTISAAAERFGIPYWRLSWRINNGWAVERALAEPSKR